MNSNLNNVIKLQSAIIKPAKKRYFILLMYCIVSMIKSFQWINLSAITNKVALYYGVDHIAVNWTSVLFMVTFIPLVLPTGWLIERIGLRKAMLIGTSGITIGAILKCFACGMDRFYVVILGQIVVSISEQFIFCIPARIASVWFPDHQVSLATAFGIMGNQCGIALGFIIPQAIMKGLETRQEIGEGLYKLFCSTALVSGVSWLILIFLFNDTPKHAPGKARLMKIQEEKELKGKQLTFSEEMNMFGRVLMDLMKSWNCVELVMAYGINVGIGYAIQTVLNQMVLSANWPNVNECVGNAGLIVIFCGMIGALFWGHLCDVTHRYILIMRFLYIATIISITVFGVTLKMYNEFALYGASALMGFVLIGYTVVGLDTIVELTYPAPELVSTSVMNLTPQMFGAVITFASSSLVDKYGSDIAIGFLVGLLSIGMLITMAIREHLNRQTAVIGLRDDEKELSSIR